MSCLHCESINECHCGWYPVKGIKVSSSKSGHIFTGSIIGGGGRREAKERENEVEQ